MKNLNRKMTHSLEFSETESYKRLTEVLPAAIHTGSVVLVDGPAASGKSCLLEEVSTVKESSWNAHTHEHVRTTSPALALQHLFEPFANLDEKDTVPKASRVGELAQAIIEKEVNLLVLDDASIIPPLALQVIFDVLAEVARKKHRIGVIMSGNGIIDQMKNTLNGPSFVQTTIQLRAFDPETMLRILNGWKKTGFKTWIEGMQEDVALYERTVEDIFHCTKGNFRRLVSFAELLILESDNQLLKTSTINRVLSLIKPDKIMSPRQMNLPLSNGAHGSS